MLVLVPPVTHNLVLALVPGFTKTIEMDDDVHLPFVAEAKRTIVDRCNEIDSTQYQEFVEQDLGSVVSADHALHSFAEWPGRDAAGGKDYVF